jgi:lipopolysaccharide export system protein LptC
MLPFRSGRSGSTGASASIFLLSIACCAVAGAQPQASPADAKTKGKSTLAPGGVPLPIGHEAKGLVLPDYDEQGRLQARFEAATAKRVDDDSIVFTGLKMTTYVVETNTPDLSIDLPAAALNITTRIVTSDQRTTVTRADFSIAGDTMRFDTVAREGRLMGNVKMVINDSAELAKALGE